MASSITFKSVAKTSMGKTVLADLSFGVEGKSAFALVGRNGSGKSLILRLLAGLSKTNKGNIYIKGQDIGYTQVKGPKFLKGFGLDNPIDVSAFSDTFMTLAAIAPFADKPVHIKGISHTRKQESDRVHAIAVGLEKLGVKVEEQVDDLIIYPADKDQLHGAVVSSFHDHRIAMSLALVGLMVPGVVIEDADAVCKTCPDYFEMLKQACSGNN